MKPAIASLFALGTTFCLMGTKTRHEVPTFGTSVPRARRGFTPRHSEWPLGGVCGARAPRVHRRTMTKSSEATPPVPLDSRPGLVLTTIGRDRPGLVNEVTSRIRALGGNLEDTQMSKLGGEFAALMLVTGNEEILQRITESIPLMQSALGLVCFIKSTQTSRPSQDAIYRVHVSGTDRIGIVELITQAFSKKKVNVIFMKTHIGNAPLTGTPLFILDANIVLPPPLLPEELEASLLDACEGEDLEFSLAKEA